MKQSRVWIRALLGLTLVAACLAAAIAPTLSLVNAAPPLAPAAALALPAAPGALVISSFRFQGANGDGDEYVEIYNRGTTPIDLSTYQLRASAASAGQWAFSPPGPAPIAPGQYYVIGGAAYAPVGNERAANTKLPAADDIIATNGGVGLFDGTATGANQVDAAGFSADGYVEGRPLTSLATTESYYRALSSSNQYIDRNYNFIDFAAQTSGSVTVTPAPGIPTITISGTTGLPNVTLTLTEGVTRTVTSVGTSGNYVIYVLNGWAGTVTPSYPGYTFSPLSTTYTAAQTTVDLPNQNYTPATSTPTTSGVVINEVGWYGTIGNTANDWIELYNATSSDINFSADPAHPWVLEAQDGNPTIQLTGTIRAGGFYLLGHTSSTAFGTSTPNAATATSTGCNIFQNVHIDQFFIGDLEYLGETLFLVNPTNAVVDYANRNGGSWPAGSASLSRSMERHAWNLPDQDSNWYTFYGTPTVRDCNGNWVYGTPGFANWAASVTATPSPVPTKYKTATAPPPTPFGHMTINEFLPRAGYDWNQDGKVDVYDEFIELYNLGPVNANLNGWSLSVISPGGNSTYSLSGLTMKPGDRMVFYHLKTNVELPDMGGTVRLLNNRGVVVDARGYGPVQAPDQSTCRIPDGQYWRFPCFPTPGLENSLTGTHPIPPPALAPQPPPCVMSDIIPTPFREAECYSFGADVYNPAYWDNQAGFRKFPVPDVLHKWLAVVQ